VPEIIYNWRGLHYYALKAARRPRRCSTRHSKTFGKKYGPVCRLFTAMVKDDLERLWRANTNTTIQEGK
jgi:hypothetical protein